MRITVMLCIAAACAFAQTHELGLTLGRISGASRSGPSQIDLGGGVALQANYGYRFALTGKVAWTGEFHFLANGARQISSANRLATRDLATAYFTPGLRVKYLGWKALQPYGMFGAGYALYEQSYFRLDGASNDAPRFTHRGAIQYGGGVDFPLWRFIGGRLEARDFYSGNPSYNLRVQGGQHNVVFGGGFTLSWGRSE